MPPQLPGDTRHSDDPFAVLYAASASILGLTVRTYRLASPSPFALLVSSASWLFFWTLRINTALVVLTNIVRFRSFFPVPAILDALYCSGWRFHLLGWHIGAMLSYQEFISTFQYALVATGPWSHCDLLLV